jgi:hypothetical protein
MTLLFFLKPHYGTSGGVGGGQQVYDDAIYDRVQVPYRGKKKKVNPALIHPFFADNPTLIPAAEDLLGLGFDLEEILLLFMMTER